MATRTELLQSLLAFERPLALLLPELSAFGWDSDEPLVVLRRSHLSSVLDRYLAGNLGPEDVEEWANAIEGREDVGYEPAHADLLRELIFDLANPCLTRALDPEAATNWRKLLE